MTQQSSNYEVLFHEEQQFRQPWIWALVLIISAAVLALAFTQHSWWFVLAIVLLDLAIVGLMYFLKLTTEVRTDGMCIRFFPMFRQTIPLSRISNHYARVYRPIWEYGGWGVRFWWRGRAYNVSGNRGVQLELSNGKRLLIGSQRAEDLERAITAAKARVSSA